MIRVSRENGSIVPKRVEDATDLARLNHFLKTHREARAGRGDLNVMALRQNSDGTETIVAAARLILIVSDEQPHYWLRGVFVDPDHRRQGIASQLLTYMEDALSQNGTTVCTAFPYDHLQAFYSALGYEPCQTLPKTLKIRYQSALDQGKDWLCMQKRLPPISS